MMKKSALLLGLLLAAAPVMVTAAPVPSSVQRAVAATDRLPSDVEKDAQRKPAEVMAFFGVRPGMRILDLYSGGGYFAELLSRAVGPKGLVLAHNNSAYLGFAKADLEKRDYAGRLPQVKLLMAENNRLALAPGSLDMIWFSLGYHDLTLDDAKEGWEKIDRDRFRAQIFSALKPGGVLAIIDHAAVSGSNPVETGHSVHRIDPDAVKAELEAVGFKLEATSDILRNPEDDHTKVVFDPAVRGRTDRFIMKFRKPK